MSNVLNKPNLAKRFMESSGWTNECYNSGVRKNGNGHLYDYYEPEKMLRDFLRFLKKQQTPVVVERVINYTLIDSWVCHYRLITITSDVEPHLNSKLSHPHAILVWQLKGIRSSVQVGKAFGVSAKAVRDVWNDRSHRVLISEFEESK